MFLLSSFKKNVKLNTKGFKKKTAQQVFEFYVKISILDAFFFTGSDLGHCTAFWSTQSVETTHSKPILG